MKITLILLFILQTFSNKTTLDSKLFFNIKTQYKINRDRQWYLKVTINSGVLIDTKHNLPLDFNELKIQTFKYYSVTGVKTCKNILVKIVDENEEEIAEIKQMTKGKIIQKFDEIIKIKYFKIDPNVERTLVYRYKTKHPQYFYYPERKNLAMYYSEESEKYCFLTIPVKKVFLEENKLYSMSNKTTSN